MKDRPVFKDIKSYEEFLQYYWYRAELKVICKGLGIAYTGTKQELNNNIKQYFMGNTFQSEKTRRSSKKIEMPLSLESQLLEYGFSFNQKFREFFSEITGIENFKFTADMAAAWRKVKSENDLSFTIRDMLKVYYGKSDYAKYDNSVCQWNQFVKDFCADKKSLIFVNKLKAASVLWKEVKKTTGDKVYKKELLEIYFDKLKEYYK